MSVVLVTGSCGLVGSETVRFFSGKGFDVAGIDNNMREYFFGREGSTAGTGKALKQICRGYRHFHLDIRDARSVRSVFKKFGREISLIIHTAAQPSHDWAARDPLCDFDTNARATLLLLESFRKTCPGAVFIFTSTNKVYGDACNALPFLEEAKRYEIPQGHRYDRGIDETMPVDPCLHSLFGASKLAADVMVQEYGRYFGLKTGVFRAGCLTGPAHAGVQLHGFLSYLVKCAVAGIPYRIFGYKGKQVRDNLLSSDLVSAFYAYFLAPRCGEVYNIGGGRSANVSILEAIERVELLTGRRFLATYQESPRNGDHQWWISDTSKFVSHFPCWRPSADIASIINQLYHAFKERI